MRLSTIDGLCLVDLLDVSFGVRGGGLARNCLSGLLLGEASGDKEGNDSSVFADVGVTRECFRVPFLVDFRDAVET